MIYQKVSLTFNVIVGEPEYPNVIEVASSSNNLKPISGRYEQQDEKTNELPTYKNSNGLIYYNGKFQTF